MAAVRRFTAQNGTSPFFISERHLDESSRSRGDVRLSGGPVFRKTFREQIQLPARLAADMSRLAPFWIKQAARFDPPRRGIILPVLLSNVGLRKRLLHPALPLVSARVHIWGPLHPFLDLARTQVGQPRREYHQRRRQSIRSRPKTRATSAVHRQQGRRCTCGQHEIIRRSTISPARSLVRAH